jgi:hypothetical protein
MFGYEKWSSCLKHYVFKDKDGRTKISFSICMRGWIATLQNQPNGFLWRKKNHKSSMGTNSLG